MKRFFLICVLLFSTPTWAADPISTSWRNDVAVSGWDIVSFYQGEPTKGVKDITHVFMGAEWRFANEAHRDLFAINPDVFLPEYGGYCAWAVAHDKLARGNPEHWAMIDGKLYFNFNGRTKRLWTEDRSLWLAKSERYWPEGLD